MQIVNGIILNEEEILLLIKEYFPSKYDKIINYDNDNNDITPLEIKLYELEFDSYTIGKFSHDMKDKKYVEAREILNGLNWFTWKCCSELSYKKFILGICLNESDKHHVNYVVNNIVKFNLSKVILNKDNLPEMFKDKEIITIYMLDYCISC